MTLRESGHQELEAKESKGAHPGTDAKHEGTCSSQQTQVVVAPTRSNSRVVWLLRCPSPIEVWNMVWNSVPIEP
jgi:hypothetical protein